MPSGSVDVVDIRRAESSSRAFAAGFLGETAVFVLAEGGALFLERDGAVSHVALHDGAILSSAFGGGQLLTAGDDGQVMAIGADLVPHRVISDSKRRWINCLATSALGDVAWGVGKQVMCCTQHGVEQSLSLEAVAADLEFSADGIMLAVSHNNGLTLWGPDTGVEPICFAWKGAHERVCFSPDGKVVATTMREPGIHAWRIADGVDLPTPAYPARVRSFGWTASGRYLVTGGSHRLTALSLGVYDNPLARMPLFLAPYQELVDRVTCHPRDEVAAVGYADGLVLLVKLPFGEEIPLKTSDGHRIGALTWNSDGSRLAIASESGQVRVVEFRKNQDV